MGILIEMVHKEKLEFLLSDVRNLETLLKGLLQEEALPVQSLSRTCNLTYSILEKLKAIESEQIQQMNIQLVEQQEELNHLSALLEQYRVMADTYKQNIQAAREEAIDAEAASKIIPEASSAVEEMPERKAPSDAEVAKPEVVLHDVLEKQNLTDFRKAFSLNDRFRFRRELFQGKDELMNKAIEDLNRTTSFADAMEYVNTHLAWDLKEEAAADFVKLLEKRYL